MEAGGSCDGVEVHAVMEELVAQDPRCFYTMNEACLRRYASHGCASELHDMAVLTFIHPAAAMVLNQQQAGDASDAKTNSSSSKMQAQGPGTTSSSTAAEAEGGLLNNWKQTQAFLSALLSYRKGILLLWDSEPGSDLQLLDRGMQAALRWFSEEGVLDALKIPGAAEQMSGNKGSSIGAAGAGGGKAKAASTSSSPESAGATADPEEAPACRMLALCVLSRVLITFCQQLAGVGSKGNRGSSSSPATGINGGAGVSKEVAALAEQLKRIDFTEGDMLMRLQLGCSLGMACYCLLKQVQQYGICGSSSKSGSSSSSSGTANGAVSNGSSSVREGGNRLSKGTSKGSKGKGGGELSATATQSSSSSSSSSQKWGGLQLELPPSVIKSLQGLELWVTRDILQEECAISQKMLLEQGESILIVGNTAEGRIDLLEELLLLCEGVVAAVPVPLGCNNPSCVNLDGVSEASAAKVCSGCKKAHYCGAACVKAHWKEHKPYCK